MNILYLGDDYVHSTSAHRAAALRRLGHEVVVFNPRAHIPRHRVVSGLNVRTGFRLFASWVGARLRAKIEAHGRTAGAARFDLVWIDGCPELPLSFYRWMKARGLPLVCYNIDDPFGKRDRRKWDLLKQAVRHQDLTVVVREENVAEARQLGARQVLRVYRSYDPVAHASVELSEDDRHRWASEVSFVGTWMPERGPFMARLLDLDVPLAIWGDLWYKAAEWPRLQPCWRGPAVYGPDYIKAIQCSKVALGLLSRGNRDLHTTRSAEVPFIGGAVFCAQRTIEHSFLLEEGEEALFWDDADECARRCRELLAEAPRRERMTAAARRRIVVHRLSNDEVIADILGRAAARHLPETQQASA
jgi:hypothetical protein